MKDTSLNNFLYQNGAKDDLRHLIIDIATSSKYIIHSIKTGDLGIAGTSNLYGEKQLALDILSDKIITDSLIESNLVCALASEEKEDIQTIDSAGKYAVVFDPLDGSSLVGTNLAVGSIFGIFESNDLNNKTGKDLIAALYVMYGPRTTLIFSIGNGVHEFTLNDVYEYVLTKKNIIISNTASSFSPGNINSIKTNSKYNNLFTHWITSNYKLRYSGGMVPDVNSILLREEGIFSYPGTNKTPKGKLRLLYECIPMAYIISNAGGKASNGYKDILDIKIESVNQRTPIFIGSKNAVEKVEELLKVGAG